MIFHKGINFHLYETYENRELHHLNFKKKETKFRAAGFFRREMKRDVVQLKNTLMK